MSGSVRWLLWGAAIVVGLYAIHRFALWAESRGWIYYRKRGRGGAFADAALEVQTILEPSKRHVLEERRREVDEEGESGDPPSPNNSRTSRLSGSNPSAKR